MAIPLASIEKLIRKAGAYHVSEDAARELSKHLEEVAVEVTREALSLSSHAGRKKVIAEDIRQAYRGPGRPIRGPRAIEAGHIGHFPKCKPHFVQAKYRGPGRPIRGPRAIEAGHIDRRLIGYYYRGPGRPIRKPPPRSVSEHMPQWIKRLSGSEDSGKKDKNRD